MRDCYAGRLCQLSPLKSCTSSDQCGPDACCVANDRKKAEKGSYSTPPAAAAGPSGTRARCATCTYRRTLATPTCTWTTARVMWVWRAGGRAWRATLAVTYTIILGVYRRVTRLLRHHPLTPWLHHPQSMLLLNDVVSLMMPALKFLLYQYRICKLKQFSCSSRLLLCAFLQFLSTFFIQIVGQCSIQSCVLMLTWYYK